MRLIDSLQSFAGKFTNAPGFITTLQNILTVLATESMTYSLAQDYTFSVTDNIGSLYVDTTAANVTIYLPPPTGSRRRTVVKTVAANILIIDGSGSTIYGPGGWVAGVAQAFINGRWESLTFEPTGSAWAIVGAVP